MSATDYRNILAAPGYGSVVRGPERWCWRHVPGSTSGLCRRPVEDVELGLCRPCISDLRGDSLPVRIWRKAVA